MPANRKEFGLWRALRLAMFAIMACAAGAGLLLPAFAKTPGHTYCFYGKCHRVKTLPEMQSLVGTEATMASSHYDSCTRDRYNPCRLTSSGEAFAPDSPDNAASPIFPDGTIVLVRSPLTGESAVLRINNAGPYWGDRTLDVSRAVADRLGFRQKGVEQLSVRVLSAPTKDDATYQRNRKYEPVLGHLGQFESMDAAYQAVTAYSAFEAIASAAFAPAAGHALIAAKLTLPNDGPQAQPTFAVAQLDTGPQRRPRRIPRAAPVAEPARDAAPVVAALTVRPLPVSVRQGEPRMPSLTRRVIAPLATVAADMSRKPVKPAAQRKAPVRATKLAALQPKPAPAPVRMPSATNSARPVKVTAPATSPASQPVAIKPLRKSTPDHMAQGFQPHASAFKKDKAKALAAKTTNDLKGAATSATKATKPAGPAKLAKRTGPGPQKSAKLHGVAVHGTV